MKNTFKDKFQPFKANIRFGSRWYDFLLQMAVIFVSITISFLFNEWREKQKNRELELFYFKQIKQDIEEDLIELENDVKSYQFLKKGYLFYRDYDAVKNPYPDSLGYYSNIFFSETYPHINNLGFETMQQSGKLDLISNAAILRQLLKVNQEVLPDLQGSIEGYLRFKRQLLDPYFYKNLRYDKKTKKGNLKEMLLQPEFVNLTLIGSNSFNQIIERYENLITEYQKLDGLIKKEVTK